MNYEEISKWLGDRESKRYSRICTVSRGNDETFTVTLHSTIICRVGRTAQGEEVVQLNSGGWRTQTTKRYMNDFLPLGWNLYQERGVWLLEHPLAQGEPRPYVDNIKVYSSGKVAYPTAYVPDPKAMRKLSDKIARYARSFAKAVVANEVPAPSGADCWDCYFVGVSSGKTLGDLVGNGDHLRQHIEENYFVPSLLSNALKENPIGPIFQQAILESWSGSGSGDWVRDRLGDSMADQVASAIRRYLHRRLDGLEA